MRVFSVGSADCILLQNGQHAMLIDSATADQGVRIAQTIRRLGIENLDYVVATHPHSDHAGGFPDILSEIPAKQALISPLRSLQNYQSYRALNAMFDTYSVPVHEAEPGETFPFGNRARIEILLSGVPSDNENEASLVIRVVYGNVSMLFMGDAEAKCEQALLSSGFTLQSDFIKLGHHGSKTSSSAEFLAAVRPKFAVVSCGEAVPLAEETLLTLDQMGLRAYRTDLDGDLLFATDGTLCEIKGSEIS
ncbi:MAG: MBL fold metallo-hydrolase [Firmicutes bacterium]|nr:MBL fold metallo-hydrolase [Bacillota bacterium]